MAKTFASQGDPSGKKISFVGIGDGPDTFAAEGDPGSGVISGDGDGSAGHPESGTEGERLLQPRNRQAHPDMVLTDCHAVRVLGA